MAPSSFKNISNNCKIWQIHKVKVIFVYHYILLFSMFFLFGFVFYSFIKIFLYFSQLTKSKTKDARNLHDAMAVCGRKTKDIVGAITAFSLWAVFLLIYICKTTEMSKTEKFTDIAPEWSVNHYNCISYCTLEEKF